MARVDREKPVPEAGTEPKRLHTPNGFGISKLVASLDKVLKVPLTARNWNTVLKLMELAGKVESAG